MFAALPLAILYMKNALAFNAFQIMTVTSIGLGGYISGYAVVGKLMRKLGTRKFQILTHCIFIVFLVSLFMLQPQWTHLHVCFAVLFYLHGIGASFLLCFLSVYSWQTSATSFSLSREAVPFPTAIISTFQSLGTMIGRTGGSIILGLALLNESWTLWGGNFTKYNALFALSLCMIIFSLLFLLLSPSVVPRHKDYYEPSN